MKTLIRKLVAVGAAALSLALPVEAQDDVNVDELLRAMREMTVSQGNKDVMGSIRKGRNKVPFSLSARGETIVFQYKHNNAWQRFDVRIKERTADLVLVNKGKAQVMASSSYAKTIAGTDVCYEDLSLRFLYWKGGRLINDSANSRVKGRDCYIVEVKNPSPGVGQFAWVRMWVDKDNGTTWQIDGYGADGKLKKRFSITSVQRLSDGSWFFKQMRLEVRNPKDPNRTIALDYLEMDDLPDRKK
ncbi:MAG: outer membrane lipoprotein-sorting protein [Akkermansia sp.]|nr:outer membrane lipoprotein-sorting protein [Akkermansia sp.]